MLASLSLVSAILSAQTPTEDALAHVGVLPATLEASWALFTTTNGIQKWVAVKAECDFRVGGSWRSSYDTASTLHDEKTIVNEITAYDPLRMIAMKCTQTPKGFPWPEAFKKCWTVIYFEKVEGGTQVTFRSFGYEDSEEGQKLREFFKAGNQQVMESLIAAAKS